MDTVLCCLLTHVASAKFPLLSGTSAKILLIFYARLLVSAGRPVPLTYAEARTSYGISHRAFAVALRQLQVYGFLRIVGTASDGRTMLYILGDY